MLDQNFRDDVKLEDLSAKADQVLKMFAVFDFNHMYNLWISGLHCNAKSPAFTCLDAPPRRNQRLRGLPWGKWFASSSRHLHGLCSWKYKRHSVTTRHSFSEIITQANCVSNFTNFFIWLDPCKPNGIWMLMFLLVGRGRSVLVAFHFPMASRKIEKMDMGEEEYAEVCWLLSNHFAAISP